MKKIIGSDELKKFVPLIYFKKKVLVGGCFDIFHYGHLTFLKNARKIGYYLIVLLECDEFIKKNKKREPIHTQQQRAEILSSIKYVDLIVKLPLLTSDKKYYDLVKLIKPKIIATTKGDPQLENKTRQASKVGGELKVVSSLLESYSTQKIINILRFEL
ncbi:adenylyltransferase/cytidyltransferase family protein [Candidatus Roizmanbacteria bacterium]|nr:adenylyltransferase/cytidyltransferase family protein [Candidatus Roizmanbacteria bacterium]